MIFILYFLLSTILNILFKVDVTTGILIFWHDLQTQCAIMVQMLWVAFAVIAKMLRVAFATRLLSHSRARAAVIYYTSWAAGE